jgi:hypothetical protein
VLVERLHHAFTYLRCGAHCPRGECGGADREPAAENKEDLSHPNRYAELISKVGAAVRMS